MLPVSPVIPADHTRPIFLLNVPCARGIGRKAMPRLTSLVPIPAGLNAGLDSASNAFMLEMLGAPRRSYGTTCQPVTNPALKRRIVTANLGPFTATGLDSAVAALGDVLADIKVEQPQTSAALGTAGMLCARLVRGSATSISNHSWGTAIDLTIGKMLDARGNGRVQYGLTLIAPIFNRHGWYWGAGFPTEDGMHFEVSRQLLTKWAAQSKKAAG
jgi:D-alanyl-D-alanine carboxypeptidase